MTRTLICALGLGALVGSAPLQAAEDPGIALPAGAARAAAGGERDAGDHPPCLGGFVGQRHV